MTNVPNPVKKESCHENLGRGAIEKTILIG